MNINGHKRTPSTMKFLKRLIKGLAFRLLLKIYSELMNKDIKLQISGG